MSSMPSQVEHAGTRSVIIPRVSSLRFLTRIGILVAFGLILFLFESAIPRPLPWLKPGLSNLVTILALYLYGFAPAFLVMLLRVMMGAFVLGTLFNPVFIFALCGGLISTIVMGLVYLKFRDVFSVIGISLLGAFFHNLTQVLLAAFLVVGNSRILVLLPVMLLSSLFSGFLVGIFAHYMLEKMSRLRLR